MNLKNKNILVTGANGLVGIPTIEKCLELGAKKVLAVDLNTNNLLSLREKYTNLDIKKVNLIYLNEVEELFKNKIDIVLHLAGIKGNPNRAKNCPADYFFPMVMFNSNVIKAAFDAKVQWLVYLSSVGVYKPADIMKEDDVWQTMPSINDWYPGWAKRCGELALESLKVQHNWDNYTIIRPANIFGKNDNFSPDATVIASNVYKLFNSSDNILECWGDGSPRRDFVFADDVAQATIDVVEKEVKDIINFGSGNAVSIKETIETLVDLYQEKFNIKKEIRWNTDKPNGDMLRCLDLRKQKIYSILPKTSFKNALEKTIIGYMEKNKGVYK